MCAQVAPSGEYLRGHGRVAVDVTALRRLWQHLPVLGLVVLACVPVYAVVVAVCQLLIKTIIIIIIIKWVRQSVCGVDGHPIKVTTFFYSKVHLTLPYYFYYRIICSFM